MPSIIKLAMFTPPGKSIERAETVHRGCICSAGRSLPPDGICSVPGEERPGRSRTVLNARDFLQSALLGGPAGDVARAGSGHQSHSESVPGSRSSDLRREIVSSKEARKS